VQGDKLPIADSADFVIITMGHAKMSSLRHAAANTHVEVNAGGSAVIARAVEAAMNPTEGQRMLQAGFQGAILGGVSREKTSTSCDIDGMERVDRLVERSVVSENGQQVLVQHVQQSAKQLPPMHDIEMATKADLEAVKSNSITKIYFDTTISTNISTISALISETASVNITTVTKLVTTLVAEMREETDKKFKSMKKTIKDLRVQNEARDAKDNHNEATIEELESKTLGNEATIKDLRAQNEARDAKDAERDELMVSLQRDCSKEEKRPADNQGEGTSQKKKRKTEPTYIYRDKSTKYANSIVFMWRRFLYGIWHGDTGFETIEEALKDMAEYFENLAPPDTDANDLD